MKKKKKRGIANQLVYFWVANEKTVNIHEQHRVLFIKQADNQAMAMQKKKKK